MHWLVRAVEHVVDVFRHVHGWLAGRDTSWGRVLGGFDVIEAFFVETQRFLTYHTVGDARRVVDTIRRVYDCLEGGRTVYDGRHTSYRRGLHDFVVIDT